MPKLWALEFVGYIAAQREGIFRRRHSIRRTVSTLVVRAVIRSIPSRRPQTRCSQMPECRTPRDGSKIRQNMVALGNTPVLPSI